MTTPAPSSSSAALRSSVSAAFFGSSAGVATKLTFDADRIGYACAAVLTEDYCSRAEVGPSAQIVAFFGHLSCATTIDISSTSVIMNLD